MIIMILAILAQLPGLPAYILHTPDSAAMLVTESGHYNLTLADDCSPFDADQFVFVLPGSGGVATIESATGEATCNVLIGEPVPEQP